MIRRYNASDYYALAVGALGRMVLRHDEPCDPRPVRGLGRLHEPRPSEPPPGPAALPLAIRIRPGASGTIRGFSSYDVTGLSTVIGDDAPAYTADNEAYDPNALAAASPVLQLPAIVTVTDLVNGRSVEVRVNDRGPEIPGRVIAVTPRVAQLLDYPDGGVVEVEVKLNGAGDGGAGRRARGRAEADGRTRGGRYRATLAPPGGGAGRCGAESEPGGDRSEHGRAGAALRGPSPPWRRRRGRCSCRCPAMAARRTRIARPSGSTACRRGWCRYTAADRTLFAVNVGPYHSVEDADAALQQLLNRGVADPQIIVR